MLHIQLDEEKSIICEIIPMGKDYMLSVYGGDRAHIGSVVLAEARPSLTGEGISVTSSVINRIGHKDEVIARMFAEALAKEKNCTVVCSCGVHIDNLNEEQLQLIIGKAKELCKQMLDLTNRESYS